MFKRLKGLKDLLWALGIVLCIAALFLGLVIASFTGYHGDKERPVMDLRREKETQSAAEATAEPKEGLLPDGTLHPLSESADAGEGYLDALTILCDSGMIPLRGANLTGAAVWGSESGSLPMTDPAAWLIRYPGDGSSISPASAAMIDKPEILVIAVGSDGQGGLSDAQFKEKYEKLIRDIASASPRTSVICLSPIPTTAAYAGSDGLNGARYTEVNDWVKSVCISTGAWYGDLSDTLCQNGCLRDEYADGSGRALNTAGLRELLSYLRSHSLELD